MDSTDATLQSGAQESGCSVIELPQCVELTRLMHLDSVRYPFLLQSVAPEQSGAVDLARYDILFAFPGETLQLTAAGVTGPGAAGGSFLQALDTWWQAEGTPTATHDLPFTGGWFLYLGYELAAEVEPSLVLEWPADEPVAFATRVPAAIVNDRQRNTAYLVAETPAEELLDLLRADIDGLPSRVAQSATTASSVEVTEDPADEFLQAVRRAKDYIRAGDVFQANLSRRWQAELAAGQSPLDVYAQLCAANPAPFAGLILTEDFALASSSPERLVRRQGQRLDTRPIAGTRPRAADPAELLANSKERAEHVMLIDLERNDLGRVCTGGSVQVDEFMVIETYAHVHHIVSNVTGQAREGLTPGDLIRAVFPGGTITGCPKVRCMEIIRELEQRPRGAYTGSMGYLNLNGDCDLNILIRTISMRQGHLQLAAGSGVVADSDPERELQETRAKAKGLILALNENATDG